MAQSPTHAQLASTPPMGWNSWNHFGAHITDKEIRSVADAMATNGMREAGYVYVNIDDGWQGSRDEKGVLHPNTNFPDMKSLADYVHGKGLKLGIYSTPGKKSCAGFEGGAGHEEQDAKTFAGWGVDYLKYDICTYRDEIAKEAQGDPKQSRQMMEAVYLRMHRALDETDRDITLSISQHGLSNIWEWGPSIGAQLWRTGDDVQNNYESVAGIGFSQAGLSAYAAPGHWNDPDMLEIGNGKLSSDESRTQLTLWALLAAPLLAGNDLNSMNAETLHLLTDPEVIAIDQDPLGSQGDRVWSRGPVEVWSRSLKDGSKAVGLFNRNAGSSWISLDPALFGFCSVQSLRDVWAHKYLGAAEGVRHFLVQRHGVLLLELKGTTESTSNGCKGKST